MVYFGKSDMMIKISEKGINKTFQRVYLYSFVFHSGKNFFQRV